MSLSITHFHELLHDEHVEEAAFLYELVVQSQADTDFSWQQAAEHEERREAHIDALCIGGDLAWQRCQLKAEEGAGELYVLATIVLRQGRLSEFDQCPRLVPSINLALLDAMTDALVDHASTEQLSDLAGREPSPGGEWGVLALCLAAERRNLVLPPDAVQQPLKRWLQASLFALQQADEDQAMALEARLPAELPALTGHPGFTDAQRLALSSEDHEIRNRVILALQRHSHSAEHSLSQRNFSSDTGLWAARSCVAGPASVSSLKAAPRREAATADIIQAMGIIGLPEFVRPLVEALASEQAGIAAEALFCMTGACLLETVFEEETFDEQELFDEEKAAYREGRKPSRVDGAPYGEETQRLCTDPDRWKAWLQQHRDRFTAGLRYRLGEPVTPAVMVRFLAHPQAPFWARCLTSQELYCRYDLKPMLDVRAAVREQHVQLQALEQAAQSVQGMTPGGWYLHTRQQTPDH